MNTAVQSTVGPVHRVQPAERAGWLGSLLLRVRRERARRQARRELIALPDHVLRDIGLERGDIPGAAARLADRRYPLPTRTPLGVQMSMPANPHP